MQHGTTAGQDVTPVKETSELLFTLQVERGFAAEAFKGFWQGKELISHITAGRPAPGKHTPATLCSTLP